MAGEQTLEGQQITIRAVTDGDLVAELKFITSFNDTVKQEVKENGYLGEPFNRFSDIHNGYGFDFEAHVNTSGWIAWEKAKTARAQRAQAATVFDVVRIDNFSDGSNLTFTYLDVAWGEQPTSIGSRGDKVKIKASGMCSERTAEENAFV
jgi:hypothetical protein